MSANHLDGESLQPTPPRSNLLRRLIGPVVAVAFALVLYYSMKWTSTVSGRVTFDEQPLTTGLVSFHPVSGGAIAYGRIDENGRYELRTGGSGGLNSGDYAVTIAANDLQAPPLAAEDQAGSRVPSPLITPAKYADKETSGLRASVRWGSNEIDFNLRK